MTAKTARVLLLACLAACDRPAREKFIGGVDGVAFAVETAAVEALRDAWRLAALARAVGAPRLSEPPAPTLAECRARLAAAGFQDGVPDGQGFYAYTAALGGSLSGSFRFGFMDTSGQRQDLCVSPGVADRFQAAFNGKGGAGNDYALDALFLGAAAPVLGGTVSGEAAGRPLGMSFTGAGYASSASMAPGSGRWAFEFAPGASAACRGAVDFAAPGGGSGALSCDAGPRHNVSISAAGDLSVDLVK